MPVNKKTSKLLRNASDPFVLYLEDEPYTLTDESLKSQVDARIQKKRNWFYPAVKFISLADQVLKIRISNKEVSYEMTVKIEPDKLHITCSCGTPVQTLCNHAYQTLEKIILFQNEDYFKKFIPSGLIEIALANKKYFRIKPTNTGVSVEPDASLGSIYKIADKMTGLNFQEIFFLPHDDVPQETLRVTDLTYIILYSSRDKYFPFLLPCLGVLNKAGSDIKGFYNFITDNTHEYEDLTSDQKELNGVCQQMWQELKTENGSLISANIEQTRCALTMFNLWNKALSVLPQQPFIYRYNFYCRLRLRERPQKGRLQRIHVSKQQPQLYFQLIDKGAFCQLEMKVAVQGKDLKHVDTLSTFFICKDKMLYLLSSLKDAAVTEWMRRCGNRITVFKEHFTEFEKEYLTPLSNNYRLEIIPSKK